MTVRVTSGRAALACDVEGPEEGDAPGVRPPILYLHADVADRRVWRALAAAVGGGHGAISFDRRAFGDTTYEPEPHADVDDAVAVLDAAGARTAVVVGNSGGGQLAVDLMLAHPERVAALVLIAPAVGGAPTPDPERFPPAVRQLSDAIDQAEGAGDLEQVNLLEAHVWLDGAEQPEGRVGGLARVLFLDMNRRALAAPNAGPRREPPPAWDRLGQVAVPTLVTVGDLDLPHVRERAARVAERIAGACLVALPGVAHLPMLETRTELAEALRGFLAELA